MLPSGWEVADAHFWAGYSASSTSGGHDEHFLAVQVCAKHHPDRGGDLGTFFAGMRVCDTQRALSEPPPSVVVLRRLNWPARMAIAAVRRLRHGRKPPRVR